MMMMNMMVNMMITMMMVIIIPVKETAHVDWVCICHLREAMLPIRLLPPWPGQSDSIALGKSTAPYALPILSFPNSR